jgi:hypothetical protein
MRSVDSVVTAWRSHATLARQAGDKFDMIIEEIKSFLIENSFPDLKIPYTTSAWVARKIK